MERMKFPKRIFVYWDVDNDANDCLVTHQDIDDIEFNGERVATYELKNVKKLKITKELR